MSREIRLCFAHPTLYQFLYDALNAGVLRACLKAVKVRRISGVAELQDNCNLYKSPETSAPNDEQACLWLIN